MGNGNNQRELYRIGKNAGEDIVFSIVEYRDNCYFDIRVWTRIIPGVKDESIATKKGIRFAVDDLPGFMKGMEKLKELQRCEAHTTHIPTPGDEDGLRRLGINLTSDPNFSTKSLFVT